ncbi:phosphonoacetaldehyde reductase [Streptomyces sp. NPDC059928]|uniref:phosphonoacetaldehyde reductase n=1 Tax=unclassified Streptomyces TaxID=2593676 RepID=UPI00364DF9A9
MTGVLAERRTTVIGERGAFARLPALCADKRVLVVASKGTLHRTRAAEWLPSSAEVFTEFRPNPTVQQAMEAARFRHAWSADLVVGLGGGSALDVAKAASLLPRDADDAMRIINDGLAPEDRSALVLVPTTAGTGSEVTQFATLYQEHRKVSLDTPCARADIALIDPALTDSCPQELTWSCAFDTLAHAVESLWSIRSSQESRDHATAALRALVPVLLEAGLEPSRDERDVLSAAATLAGRAIDITRTTAAHALSYPLTARLGIPHGRACVLNLTWLVPMVENAAPDRISDEREAGALHAALSTLHSLFGTAPGELGALLYKVMERRLGVPFRQQYSPDAELIALLVAEGMSSPRMTGMPVSLERSEVRAAMAGALAGRPPKGARSNRA